MLYSLKASRGLSSLLRTRPSTVVIRNLFNGISDLLELISAQKVVHGYGQRLCASLLYNGQIHLAVVNRSAVKWTVERTGCIRMAS